MALLRNMSTKLSVRLEYLGLFEIRVSICKDSHTEFCDALKATCARECHVEPDFRVSDR